MEIGYSITSRQSLAKTPDEAAAHLLERAQVAIDAGFDYVQAGDHHAVADELYFQNVPTIARLTAVSRHVAGMFILPLHDPLMLAEHIGTIGAFADRVDFWCAVGYVEHEFEALGVPLSQRAGRLEEGLELMGRLWSEDDVTYEGDHFALDGVSINPKAEPRICIGGSAEAAVRRAGRMGDAWVASPYLSPDDLDQKLEWFEAAGGGDVILRRDALLLEDGEAADRTAMALLEDGYRGWSTDDADCLLAGGPDDVEAELRALGEAGVDEIVIRPMSGDHAPETLAVLARARDRIA